MSKKEEDKKIISWFDLSEDEKKKLIKEFESKRGGKTTSQLHIINIILISLAVAFPILSVFIIDMYDLEQINGIYVLSLLLILIIICNIISIYSINRAFSRWLITKNIIK